MNTNEIIIPCRLSYANIWEPKQVNGTGDPKYSCCLLIKKSDAAVLAKIKAAIEAVKKDPKALAKWGGKLPVKLKSPLRDGDEEKDDENFADCKFINAKASEKRRPRIMTSTATMCWIRRKSTAAATPTSRSASSPTAPAAARASVQGWKLSRRSATVST